MLILKVMYGWRLAVGGWSHIHVIRSKIRSKGWQLRVGSVQRVAEAALTKQRITRVRGREASAFRLRDGLRPRPPTERVMWLIGTV